MIILVAACKVVVRIGLVVLDDKVMAVVVALGLELPRAQRVTLIVEE